MSQRIARVNELLKREISNFVERSFEFPGVLVTIHEVSTAVDLKAAQVFVGVIGSATDSRAIVDKLNRKRGMIQAAVMKRVVLRNTPQLTFKIDDSIERGVKVLDILDEIGEIDLPDEPEEPS